MSELDDNDRLVLRILGIIALSIVVITLLWVIINI